MHFSDCALRTKNKKCDLLHNAVKYSMPLCALSISQMKWTGVSRLDCILQQSLGSFIIVYFLGSRSFFPPFSWRSTAHDTATAICGKGCMSCLSGRLSSPCCLWLHVCLLTSWRVCGLKYLCLLKIRKFRAGFAWGALNNTCCRAAPTIC